MGDTVTIPRKEYECLRRCLNEAFDIFEGLGVREQKAPKLSTEKKRMMKYQKALSKGTRIKKSDITKK